MEKTKDLKPESINEESPSGGTTVVFNNGSQEIGQLLDEELEKTPELESSQSLLPDLSEKLTKQLEEISNDLKGCKEQLSRLARETEELKGAEQIISNLSSRCRDLTEQFHEREILFPVINCLIRMADGCRQQIDKFQKIYAKHSESKNKSTMKVLTFLIDTRTANLVELENVLANLAVESYQHHDDIFEPTLQKCIDRIECEEQVKAPRIAHRLLPGYKRYDKVVRKEYVNVYVLRNKTDNTNNGGN
jgi:molecular chaperone GrpE (heat shock protein)